MKSFKRILLGIVSRPVFSRIYGRLCRVRRPRWLVRRVIRFFMAKYRIDMGEFMGTPDDYASLVEFFIRPLDPAVRPLTPVPGALVSPADGMLQTLETLHEDRAVQAKGMEYSVSEMVCESLDFSAPWHLAVVYLSPRNYHRYHYPADAGLQAFCHAGGPLYPVNHLGTTLIDRLFARNERVVVRFSVAGRPLYVVAVGATFVGSIRMEFMEKALRDTTWHSVGKTVQQLQEMGWFELGSTIVMVCPADLARPNHSLLGKAVRVGDPIFLR